MSQEKLNSDLSELKALEEQNQHALHEMRRMVENMEILLTVPHPGTDPSAHFDSGEAFIDSRWAADGS